jgi:hypothetical protein
MNLTIKLNGYSLKGGRIGEYREKWLTELNKLDNVRLSQNFLRYHSETAVKSLQATG